MPLLVNLRHLEKRDLCLSGEVAVDDLDIDSQDEMIQLTKPLRHRLESHSL